MSNPRVVRHLVLDNAGADALQSRRPTDRRRAAVVEAIAAANGRVIVPTVVRIEAGWRRRDPRAAPANRLAVRDVALDGSDADRAVELRRSVPAASVVDAAVAVAAERVAIKAPGTVEVLTSDVPDLTELAGHLRSRVVIVGL